MARIAGVDLPREKRVEIGLTYIYGIGRATARKILEQTGVNPVRRIHELSDEEVNLLARGKPQVNRRFLAGGQLFLGFARLHLQAAGVFH